MPSLKISIPVMTLREPGDTAFAYSRTTFELIDGTWVWACVATSLLPTLKDSGQVNIVEAAGSETGSRWAQTTLEAAQHHRCTYHLPHRIVKVANPNLSADAMFKSLPVFLREHPCAKERLRFAQSKEGDHYILVNIGYEYRLWKKLEDFRRSA